MTFEEFWVIFKAHEEILPLAANPASTEKQKALAAWNRAVSECRMKIGNGATVDDLNELYGQA